ncbi:MAG: helix-turn-helix transcriptional regulator [Candidatus Altiarchaeota archaeon]|nr:helix-turn-helix transcriptional regulator [Candidatus Altiarchaeota archaeon]
MKTHTSSYNQEFQELTEDLQDAVREMSDPVAIATMLYTIAEEKKSNNLVVRDINGKFDHMMEKLDRIADLLEKFAEKSATISAKPDNIDISDRDQEILSYVRSHGKVCADDVQDHFQYKGRNAASARLNKLYRDGVVEKLYAGRNVYYMIKG